MHSSPGYNGIGAVMAKNYYETLGVDRGASEKDIRSAYRRLARQHHPDVNQGQKDAEAKFKEINEAYQVLSDPDSRKKYDRFGDGWRNADYVRQGESAGPSPFTWFNRAGRARTHQTEFSFGGFDSIFSDLRGAGRGGVTEEAPFQRRSVVPVTITLEEAYTGTVRTIQLPPGGPNGHAGKRIEVRVPAGTKHESRIHVNTAKGGAHADIELTVSIAPHHLFERTGDDLRFTAKVPLIDAVLGGETDVPTLSGKHVALHIPPETQNGRVFRLRGKGMPNGKGAHGDLLATVSVVLPSDLTEEQRALFDRLRELEKATPAAL